MKQDSKPVFFQDKSRQRSVETPHTVRQQQQNAAEAGARFFKPIAILCLGVIVNGCGPSFSACGDATGRQPIDLAHLPCQALGSRLGAEAAPWQRGESIAMGVAGSAERANQRRQG